MDKPRHAPLPRLFNKRHGWQIKGLESAGGESLGSCGGGIAVWGRQLRWYVGTFNVGVGWNRNKFYENCFGIVGTDGSLEIHIGQSLTVCPFKDLTGYEGSDCLGFWSRPDIARLLCGGFVSVKAHPWPRPTPLCPLPPNRRQGTCRGAVT